MIFLKSDRDDIQDVEAQRLLATDDGGSTSASQHETAHDSEAPPPRFTEYVAEYSDNGDIVSYDPHLNTDGEALYRFILAHANKAPEYDLHIRGSHEERHSRWVTSRNREGRNEQTLEHYTETVVDFDFHIAVGQYIVDKDRIGTEWCVPGEHATYRGAMSRQVEINQDTRRASKADKRAVKQWALECDSNGQPPWFMTSSQSTLAKSLRDWTEDYCRSPKYLKTFVVRKVVYGWRKADLLAAITNSIKARLYTGNLHVTLEAKSSLIMVRSDNQISRAMHNPWIKLLLWCLLLYPIVWAFRQWHPQGGGHWEGCLVAWSMKSWEDVDSDIAQYSTGGSQDTVSVLPPAYHEYPEQTSRLVQTTDGSTKRLKGLREGEWFRRWEKTILNSVQMKYISQIPLTTPGEESVVPEAALLDGYYDS